MKRLDSVVAPPFFILGCARSGTTLLRNLLRLHPHLDAPEETFFYRWGEAFGTEKYQHTYKVNPTIKHHHKLDGVSPQQMKGILERSQNRKDLSVRYAAAYLGNRKTTTRWFDKTPQNIYGVLLLHAQFPRSPIIHIHRHPLNVVASLRAGKVMPAQSLIAAVNYWIEAAQIMDIYRKLPDNNLIEVSYKALSTRPHQVLHDLLIALNENPEVYNFNTVGAGVHPEESPGITVNPEKNSFAEMLNEKEIQYTIQCCAPYLKRLNYTREPT